MESLHIRPWGTAPLSIDGIRDYVRKRLGQDVPSDVPDIFYSQVGTHEGSFAIPARALTAPGIPLVAGMLFVNDSSILFSRQSPGGSPFA